MGNILVCIRGRGSGQLPPLIDPSPRPGDPYVPHHTFGKRFVATLSAAATVIAGGLVLAAAPAQAVGTRTDYGFQSNAYGTRVTSQNIALNMSRSAYSWIACTRKAGLNPDNYPSAGNFLASSASPSNPWVKLGSVTTANRTFRNKRTGAVGNQAVSTISDLTLTGPSQTEGVPGPTFALEGVRTMSRTWAKGGELRGATKLSSLDLELKLPEGTPVDKPLQDLLGVVDQGIGAVTDLLRTVDGKAIEVPGLGVIRLGHERVIERRHVALARAVALVIDLAGTDGQTGTADDSRITVGHSQSRISRGLPSGLMAGHGYPLQMSVADDALGIGKIGMEVLPCRGTQGKVLGETIPAQDVLDGALELGTLTSQVYGVQSKDGTGEAWTLGKVSRVALGSGDQRVELAGVVGVARVYRKAGGKLVRSTKGTSIGSFTIGGKEQTVPVDSRPVELPGLGFIRFNLVEPSLKGIRLTAAQIVLDPGGSGETVIDLGNARTEIK